MSAIQKLLEAASEMGWNVAVPEGGPDDEVPGLVVGTSEYVDKVLGAYEKAYGDKPFTEAQTQGDT